MEPTSWGGSYRPDAEATWADATMWIEDGDLGVGLTGSWTIVPAVALTDVVSVVAVGEHARCTELEITLAAGRTFWLACPQGFLDEFIGALKGTTVLDLTESPPFAPPASNAPSVPERREPLLPRPAPATAAPSGPAIRSVGATTALANDAIRCDECDVLCLTLADLRDHELVHRPRVEFVPFPSA